MFRVLHVLTAGAVLLIAGCGVHNNHKSPALIAEELNQAPNGLKVKSVQMLSPDPIGASQALAVTIGEGEIGIYKFDRTNSKESATLERLKKNGYVELLYAKFPVVVHGSFVFLGVERHPQKHQILEAIESLPE